MHDLEYHARIRVHGAVSTERTQQEGDEESAPGAVWQSGTHRIAEKVEGAKALQLTGKAAESGRYDAVIALGCLIRGGTPHFDHICAWTTRGIGDAALSTGVPVAFGVLTCGTLEQALERAGTKMGNKGVEAAMAAIEMADLLPRLAG